MATTMPATPTTVTPLPDYQGPSTAVPRHSSGPIGPFFAVLAAVLVLTFLSCIFGRVCAAQAEGPDEWYDCTRWACCRRWRWRAPRRTISREAKPAEEELKQPAALPLPLPLPEP